MAKILIISGEPSGDFFASGLIKSIKKCSKNIDCYAIGGKQTESAGAELIADIDKLSVMGFTEVLCKLKTIKKVLDKVYGWIRENKPDAVILIDFPSFNFKVAKLSYGLKIPVIYFIPPKIWASRYARIKFIKKYIRFVIVIFPFEYDIYKKAGIEVYYFGNPSYSLYNKEVKSGGIKKIGSEDKYPVISFLPGSRKAEIKYHSGRIIESMLLIKKVYKDSFFIFPFKKEIDSSRFVSVLKKKNIPEKWYVITDSVSDALYSCDVTVVASGTASLEACFYGKPVIIVYYLNYLTYLIAKVLVNIRYVGLINIMANDCVVPELIESKFTPDNVFKEVDRFLKDDIYKKSVIDKISGTVSTLRIDALPLESSAKLIYDRIISKNN
ncbi:lipid-A-disaccharide synthase [Candidatus Acidulodesulfobacterium sp. H_13]|uniref:lipid-A-disaccharide synthase n=1 Tax=Candidatus Acidulodesulfobacterium sp. H_13 TaxID=3395470 RepID=UPI003AF84518